MFKQKILILGDGLTAKLAASLLSKLDLEIELVALRANLREKKIIEQLLFLIQILILWPKNFLILSQKKYFGQSTE